MKLQRLAVTDFGRIKRAELEFGPGLNVLHGPNDLGKSTLVNAIRAVLLLQTNAKESERFHRWGSSSRPRVELDLQIQKDAPWAYHIEKSFGGSASLSGAAVGAEPRTLARNRDVDAHLREEVLKWGIRPPGRGAQRGIPESFLATVLLADQGDVDAILRDADLAQDGYENAREWLTSVLEASAVDPFFRQVLETVEQRYGEAFTETGRERRAQDAPLMKMRDEVNSVRAELEELEQAVEEAGDIRRVLAEKQATLDGLKDRLADATAEYEELAAQWEQTANRRELEETLAELKKREEAAFRRVAVIKIKSAQLTDARDKLESLEEWLETGERWVESRREALHRAEKALEAAAEGAGSDKAALQQAKLEGQLEKTRASLEELEKNVADAERIGELLAKQKTRRETLTNLDARIQNAEEELEALDDEKFARQQERMAHRRTAVELRSIELELEEIAEELEGSAEVEKEAVALDAKADELEQEAGSAGLPNEDQLEEIRHLHGDFSTAKAALNVGVELQLEPEGSLDVQVTRDDDETEAQTWSEAISVTADRHIALEIPGVGIVRVTTGTDEQRQEARRLQKAWREEGEAWLQKAGVSSLDELVEAVQQARKASAEVARLRAEAAEKRREAPELEELQERKSELEAEKARIEAELDEGAQRSVAGCGERRAGSRQELDKLEQVLAAQEKANALATEERDAQKARLRESLASQRAERKATTEALSELGEELSRYPDESRQTWESTVDSAEARRAELREKEAELQKALSEAEEAGGPGGGLADDAPEKQAVESAKAELESAKARLAELQQLRPTVADEVAELRVSLEHEEKQAEEEDVEALAAEVKELEARLKEASEAGDAVSEEAVETARRTMESLEKQVRTAELEVSEVRGQLNRGSGQTVEEERQALQARMDRLEERERQMKEEYEGWRLLRDVMHQVQENQTANLGNAVAPVIAERFRQISDRGYELAVGSSLAAEGIVAAGEAREPELFSVGTREQMATVYRLTLAERLDSVVVLDDQLVQSDRERMAGLRQLLHDAAEKIQVLIFTCRPEDYLTIGEMEAAEMGESLDGVNVIDLEQVVA